MKNIESVLAWKYKPVFLAPAHHFYNHLCGHAFSLSKGLRLILDQNAGVNTGITPLGRKVIEKLLENGIYIDIKHMSRQARREYYNLLLKPEYANIPVIISHGAVNGRPTVESNDEHNEENGKFYGCDINFYDDELIILAKSEGLFCIQLDERRIVSKSERSKVDDIRIPGKKMEVRAGFVWNQVEYIARTLDAASLNAWDTMCIGSDYDGIIDPLNGYWTEKEIKTMRANLLQHAQRFVVSGISQMKMQSNIITPERIVEKLFSENAFNFLRKNYK